MPQFVKCKFRPADTTLYTYRWDGGEPLAEGELVKVAARHDGWRQVTVVEIDAPEPTEFEAKPILGRVHDEITADTTLENLDTAGVEASRPDPRDA